MTNWTSISQNEPTLQSEGSNLKVRLDQFRKHGGDLGGHGDLGGEGELGGKGEYTYFVNHYFVSFYTSLQATP